jgi:UDP-N-acetylmuramyl pentapeptide phosphotransferase/UDP-N-acetylglucosamine-1-phosphate transferase
VRLLAAFLVSLAVAAALAPLVRRLAPRLGLVDRPGPRSLHGAPTPRAGGAALWVAAVAGVFVAGTVPHGALAAAGLVLVVGLVDDRFGLPAAVRLAAHLAAAAVFVIGSGLAAAWIVWMVVVVNFYNFMDGIDGLAATQAVITGLGVALADWHPAAVALGVGLAGASAGFLPSNWSPARLFMGDAGSGFLGFSLAALPLLAPRDRTAGAALFVAASLGLFLLDAGWTLARRAARGARIWEAHREHAYQGLVLGGWSHARATLLVAGGGAVLTGAALAAWTTRAVPVWLVGGPAVVLYAAERALARRLQA